MNKKQKFSHYLIPRFTTFHSINDVKDKSVNRENISLDEFNLIRMTNGKLDPYTLNHSFEGPIFYRLVKGEKQDKTKYIQQILFV